MLQNSSNNTQPSTTVTPDAKTILTDCIWENATNPILQYETDHPNQVASLGLMEWMDAIKATGGVIGIGWYNHEIDATTKYTFFNPITDSNNGLHTVTTRNEHTTDERSVPAYNVAGHQSIRDKINDEKSIATCVTIDEIQKNIPVNKWDTFPLQLAPSRDINMFNKTYSDEQHWDSISSYIPVTEAAIEVIQNIPWQYPRDRFLAYHSSNDPRTIIPNADKWVKLLQCSAGQLIIAWFDPNTQIIDQITYYDTHNVNGETGNMDFRYFKSNKELSGKESKYVIKETLNDSRLLPTVMSIHSLDLTEFKR